MNMVSLLRNCYLKSIGFEWVIENPPLSLRQDRGDFFVGRILF